MYIDQIGYVGVRHPIIVGVVAIRGGWVWYRKEFGPGYGLTARERLFFILCGSLVLCRSLVFCEGLILCANVIFYASIRPFS